MKHIKVVNNELINVKNADHNNGEAERLRHEEEARLAAEAKRLEYERQ